MFTRLLVGLDGSPRADAALEQAVVLGERFHSTVLVAHVRERGGPGGAAMLDRARERLLAAELQESWSRRPARRRGFYRRAPRDRRGVLGRQGTHGTPSGRPYIGMRTQGVRDRVSRIHSPAILRGGYDGGETSRGRSSSRCGSRSVGNRREMLQAAEDRERGSGAGAAKRLCRCSAFRSFPRGAGPPGEVIARVIKRVGCDALFAGAHMEPREGRASVATVSHAEQILMRTDIPVVVQP